MNRHTNGERTILQNTMTIDLDKSELRGDLRKQESMARHTSWKTGGPADYYFRPADLEDLSVFMSMVPASVPLTWVGFGSNLLVRDGGIAGVVISVSGVLNKLELAGDDSLTVGAGVSCAKVARFAARQGLSGVEFLAGIPGTIGGALAMNAGAYGGEVWNVVTAVETISRDGQCKRQARADFDVAYRSVSIAADEWFVSAEITLEKSERGTVENAIRDMLKERADAQPLGQHSCGSVFRNPPGDHAARLIEDCGLKGKSIGGAQVSDKHANFIINTGSATAADIEMLINEIQEIVFEKHAIQLQPEVRIIGEPEAGSGGHG